MGRGFRATAAEPSSLEDFPTAHPTADRVLLDRFIQSRDEEAFAVLVHRHGPMVLGVCQRVLRHREDAQDAFQITFLVLARKAATLERAELLANWLYGVAYRTASQLRGRSDRRLNPEKQVADMPAPPTGFSEEKREILEALDEELHHLPEMYRTLLVLCYLEGKTFQEAARQTECPPGSISWRVSRAREMLHKRLRRRGLVFPAALLILLLGDELASAAVTEELARTTASTAAGYAAGAAVPAEQATVIDVVLGELAGPHRHRGVLLPILALLLALLSGGVLLGAASSLNLRSADTADPGAAGGEAIPASGPGASTVPVSGCGAAPSPCQGGAANPK